jgi:arsenite methyltransferase
MQPELVISHEKTIPQPPSSASMAQPLAPPRDSLFEHVAWLYAFCREHLFRDDTERIITGLWPRGRSPFPGTRVIELGCGPGFYSAKLAKRFPHISLTGVDRSANQLTWARKRAAAQQVPNCSFARVNVLDLPFPDASFDALIASRLFTILPDHSRTVAEMHRILRRGGRCFIAEPRYAVWASIPLFAMWLLASIRHSANGYREPRTAKVFSARAFEEIFAAHQWSRLQTWEDGRYQYALCEKA